MNCLRLKRGIIFILFFTTLLLLSLRYFYSIGSGIGHNWDWTFPSLDFLFDRLNIMSNYTWWQMNLGSPLNLTIIHLIPDNALVLLSKLLGIKLTILTVLITVITVSFFSFKKLMDYLSNNTWINYMPAFLYAFSPFLLNEIIGGSWYMWISYAFAPTFFLNQLQYIDAKSTKHLLGFLLASIFVIGSPQNFALIEIILVLFLIYYKVWKNKKARQVLVSYSVSHAFLIITNLSWIIPFIVSLSSFYSTIKNPNYTGGYQAIQNSTQSIPNILLLTGYLDRNMYFYALPDSIIPVFIICVFITWILIGLYLLAERKAPKKNALVFLSILLLLIIVIKGGNGPFSGVTMWIYEHLAFMKLFRSPQHLMFAASFIIPILVGLSLNYYYNTKYKGIIFGTFTICILVWISGWWYNGDLGHEVLKTKQRDYIDFYTLSPGLKKVYEQNETSQVDHRILFLPAAFSPQYIRTEFQNKAQGGQPEYMYLKNPTVTSEANPFAWAIEEAFCKDIDLDYIKYLRVLSVRDIILRYDIYPHFTESANCWDSNKVKTILAASTSLNKFLKGKYEIGYSIKPQHFLQHIYPTMGINLVSSSFNSLIHLAQTSYLDGYPAVVFTDGQYGPALRLLLDSQRQKVTGQPYTVNERVLFVNRNFNDLVIDLARVEISSSRQSAIGSLLLSSRETRVVNKQKPGLVVLNGNGNAGFKVEDKESYEVWLRAGDRDLKGINEIEVGDYRFPMALGQNKDGKWIKLGTGEFKEDRHRIKVYTWQQPVADSEWADGNHNKEEFRKLIQSIEIVILSEEKRKEYEELLKRKGAAYLFYKEEDSLTGTQQVIDKRDFYIPDNGAYDVAAFVRPRRESVRAYAINERFEDGVLRYWNLRKTVGAWQSAVGSQEFQDANPVFLFGGNFYSPETIAYPLHEKMWRWMANDGKLILLNPFNASLTVDLSLNAASFEMDRRLDVYVNNKNQETVNVAGPSKKVSKKVIKRIKELKDLSLASGLPSPAEIKNIILRSGINEITLSPSPSSTVVGDQNRFAVSIAISDDVRVVATEPDFKPSFWVNREVFKARVQDETLILEDNYRERAEEIAWISRPTEKISLNDYPLFIIKYAWRNPQIQAMDVGFRIDTNSDGQGDAYLVRTLPDPVPGLHRFEIDLLETVWENFADAINPYLVGIDLFAHKKWGIDASGVQVENRQTYFVRGIQLASKQGSVVVKGKESFKEVTFSGKGSHTVSQDGDGLAVSINLGGRKGESAVAEVSIPLRQQPHGEAPLFILPYRLDDENVQDLKIFVAYDLNGDRKADKTVPAGRRISIPGWKLLTRDMKEPMFLYEAILPSFFPAEYNTAGMRFRNFVVIKNGVPLSPIWGNDFVISKEQAQVEGGKMVINLPRGVDPDDFSYEVFYTPKGLKESSWFHDFKEIVFDLRDLEDDLFEKKATPVGLKLVLEGKISEALEQERIYDFNIKAPRYAYSILPRLGNLSIKENMPIISLDGNSVKFDKERVDKEKEGMWITKRVSLEEGEHRLRVVEGGGLEAYLVEIKPVTSQQSPVESQQPPAVNFKKINPTRYIVDVKDAKGPFTLVFSESFHEGWKAYIRQVQSSKLKAQREEPWSAWWSAWKDGGQRFEVKDHFVVNGYANGWIVDPSAVNSQQSAVGGRQSEQQSADSSRQSTDDGQQSFEMVLEFKPQRLFEIGLMISGLTLVGCFGYLGYDFVRQRKKRVPPGQSI